MISFDLRTTIEKVVSIVQFIQFWRAGHHSSHNTICGNVYHLVSHALKEDPRDRSHPQQKGSCCTLFFVTVPLDIMCSVCTLWFRQCTGLCFPHYFSQNIKSRISVKTLVPVISAAMVVQVVSDTAISVLEMHLLLFTTLITTPHPLLLSVFLLSSHNSRIVFQFSPLSPFSTVIFFYPSASWIVRWPSSLLWSRKSCFA